MAWPLSCSRGELTFFYFAASLKSLSPLAPLPHACLLCFVRVEGQTTPPFAPKRPDFLHLAERVLSGLPPYDLTLSFLHPGGGSGH